MSYRLSILAILLMVVGCIKDPSVEPYAESEGQTITLSVLSYSDQMVASTRSTTDVPSDIVIDRGYMLFYSSDGTYKGYKSVADLNLTQSGSTVSFEVSGDFSTDDYIIAIFNHDVDADLPENFGDVTSENLYEYFPISNDYLAKVEADMNDTKYELGMPMYLNDFTDSERDIREVYRSVARMELFIKDGLTIDHDSHTHSIGEKSLKFELVNIASASSLAAGSSDKYATENCIDIDTFEATYPYSLTGYSTSATDSPNKIYLHSYPYSTQAINGNELDATTFDEERFAIILKHSDTNVETDAEEPRYYKLNMLDKATSTYFDIERNHSYRVVITAVNSRGYETLKEAYEMPPSNIEYEIYDDQGGLTYSNGQYAISMDEVLSYDEVLVYSSNETTIEFSNIRYVLPDEGQMDDAYFETNEVWFEVLTSEAYDDPNSYDEPKFEVVTSSDFDFVDNRSVLTSEGQSITLTISGEGECTIALRVRLGNLETGRDEITIKKIATNGDGDGSFDAHPNHIEIVDQPFIEGSWQSDDIDFGARASNTEYDDNENATVIYMGENATPTGYRTMDGYVSGESAVDSYPVYSPKTRKGYYSYTKTMDDGTSEVRKVMIQLDQLAPFYLGHFGNTASDESVYHYNGLICEKIEEVSSYNWDLTVLSERDGVLVWSQAQMQYYSGTIWGDYLSLGDRYHNLVEGLAITKDIVDNNTTEGSLPTAALYCYMKNDINGNNKIDSDEPIVWYLPAQNQMLAMWINMNVLETEDDGLYKLNNDGTQVYYWTSSEFDSTADYTYNMPSDFTQFALRFNTLEGVSDYGDKSANWDSCHVRCVRGVD